MMDRSDRHDGGRIVLSGMDQFAYTRDVRALLATMVKRASPDATERKVLRDGYTQSFSGLDFVRTDIVETNASLTVYKGILVTKYRDFFLVWSMASLSPDGLEKVVHSLNDLSFARLPGDTLPVEALTGGVVTSAPMGPSCVTSRTILSETNAEQLIVARAAPKYPETFRGKHQKQTVLLDVVVGQSGEPWSVIAVSGERALFDAASDAVSHWKFKPYTIGGDAGYFETTVWVEFPAQ